MIIAKYLKKQGLKQAEFGRSVGICQGQVAHLLSGRCRVTAELASTIDLVTEGELTRAALRPDIFWPESQRAARRKALGVRS